MTKSHKEIAKEIENILTEAISSAVQKEREAILKLVWETAIYGGSKGDRMSYPVKCQICEGHGNVPGGFYYSTPGFDSASNVTQEICLACQGAGIIWTRENQGKIELT